MKRMLARLMLFGIPCAFSYLATRPVAPQHAPEFVICSVSESSDHGGRELVIAVNAEACAAASEISSGPLPKKDSGFNAKGNPSAQLPIGIRL